MTVNPDSDLADGKVYVEVGSGFYDEDGNQGSELHERDLHRGHRRPDPIIPHG